MVRAFPEEGAAKLYHEAAPGFLNAMQKPYTMEFLVIDKAFLSALRAGLNIGAGVRKRGSDYILEPIPKRTKR